MAITRASNPKPVLLLLMVIAFFGGSCTVQDLMEVGHEPTREEIGKALGLTPGGEVREQALGDAAYAIQGERSRIVRGMEPLIFGFGAFLAFAHGFVALMGMRALSFARNSIKHLAFAALLVLPARVAYLAVETSLTYKLLPAARTMTQQVLAAAPEPVPLDPAELGGVMIGVILAFQGAVALVVLALFSWARRYLPRPDVTALFDRMAPPEDDLE